MNMQTTGLKPDTQLPPCLYETVIGLMQEASAFLSTDPGAANRCIVAATGLLQDVKEAREPATSAGLAPWQVRRVRVTIESRIEEPITNAELAAVARLSLSHFARAFRRSFGTSPHSYIIAKRVARAKELMSSSDESLAQIAAACGFFDQAHFSKIFRQVEQSSPNDWRRLMRSAAMDGRVSS